MSIKLEKLKEEIPFKWRVQSFSKRKPLATCVAYIDSRDVQNKLDEVCSPANWQDDYKKIDEVLYCGIGIKIEGEWVWKWDCGVESNQDSEKGAASDAFKRAAVKWGIGRFLYSMDIQYLPANEAKTSNNYPYVVDNKGKKVWDITKEINNNSKKNGYNKPPEIEEKPKEKVVKIEKSAEHLSLEKEWNTILDTPQIFSNEEKEKYKLKNFSVEKLKAGIKTLIEMRDKRERELELYTEDQNFKAKVPHNGEMATNELPF